MVLDHGGPLSLCRSSSGGHRALLEDRVNCWWPGLGSGSAILFPQPLRLARGTRGGERLGWYGARLAVDCWTGHAFVVGLLAQDSGHGDDERKTFFPRLHSDDAHRAIRISILRIDDRGTYRIGDSRVLLELVIRSFEAGATPETIVQQYPTTKLEDIYAVIAYYLRHREDVAAYLQEREQLAEEVRARIEARQGDLQEICRRFARVC